MVGEPQTSDKGLLDTFLEWAKYLQLIFQIIDACRTIKKSTERKCTIGNFEHKS